MTILTPPTLPAEEVAWEGELEPLGLEAFRSSETARVRMGKPVWWPAAQAWENETGRKWSAPAGNRRYTLVRLSCTLYEPQERFARFEQATLQARLSTVNGGGGVTVHDLYPERLSTPRKGKWTVKLGPTLRFAELVEAGLGEIGIEIGFEQALPVVQAYGRGQREAEWRFTYQPAQPLLGDLSVYLVIDAPAGEDLWLDVSLLAQVASQLGPLRLGLGRPLSTRLGQRVG